jgi:hypothetical protein
MTSKWMREVSTSGTGSSTGIPFALKATALFLRYCLGFTEDGSTASFAIEKSGTNGAINTGNNKRFMDTVAGSFVSGDTGKWLLVCGDSRNAGWYKVTYIDANNVDLDFRSAATEYPNVQTGLSWYLMANTYSPPTNGQYFRLKTPHIYGWSLQLLYSTADNQRVEATLAPDGNWSTTIGPAYSGSTNSTTNWVYCEADSYGQWVHLMFHQSTNNRHNGLLVTTFEPFETGYENIEKVGLFGSSSSAVGDFDNTAFQRVYDASHVGQGFVWDSAFAIQRHAYMVEPTYAGYASGLSKWTSRERNRRRSGANVGGGTGDSIAMSGSTATLTDAGASFVTTDVGKAIRVSRCSNQDNNGFFVVTARLSATQVQYTNASGVNETSSFSWSMDKQDIIEGTIVAVDENNSEGRYSLRGRMLGHFSTRSGTTGGWAPRKAFDESGLLDKFHWIDGFAFQWPNLTPQH